LALETNANANAQYRLRFNLFSQPTIALLRPTARDWISEIAEISQNQILIPSGGKRFRPDIDGHASLKAPCFFYLATVPCTDSLISGIPCDITYSWDGV
jgi:hypothetical protein